MKKSLIVLLNIIMASALYADAFKLMGGLNLAKYSLSPKEGSIDWSYKLGFCVGGGFEIGLVEDDIIAVEVDGFLIQKKGSRAETSALNDSKSDYHLNTLCVPVISKIKFKYDSAFYVLGGGAVSLVLSHKFERKMGSKKEQIDLKEDTKNFDFGLVLGCGYEMKVNKYQRFFIEGRYHLGFVNLLRDSEESQSVRGNAILIILGIKSY